VWTFRRFQILSPFRVEGALLPPPLTFLAAARRIGKDCLRKGTTSLVT
jgi:hypothetical protein